MKKLIFFIMFIYFSFIISGCSAEKAAIRIVTGITVTESRDGRTVKHTYTQDRKTSHILNYLRILDPYISVALAEDTFRTDIYRIEVNYSDGNTTCYNQIHNDYFRTEQGVWKRIDPDIGGRLSVILEKLEDDI